MAALVTSGTSGEGKASKDAQEAPRWAPPPQQPPSVLTAPGLMSLSFAMPTVLVGHTHD